MKNMQALKTVGAALFAFGLVCAELLVSGCGAAPEDELDIGQTSEPLRLNGLADGRLMGVNVSSPSLDHCMASGPTTQRCEWVVPYFWDIGGADPPARYGIRVNPSGMTSADVTLVNNVITSQILPLFNGELGHVKMLWETVSAGTSENVSLLQGSHSPAAAVGDTNVYDYLSIVPGNCQSAARTESPSENGTFRSCKDFSFFVDFPRLKANFATNRYSGNIKQIVAACMDMAMGAGLQRNIATTYTGYGLSVTTQSFTVPFSPIEAKQTEAGTTTDPNFDTFIGFFP